MPTNFERNMLQPHDYWMRLALAQARTAFEKDEVPVGAVVVHQDKEVIAEASVRSQERTRCPSPASSRESASSRSRRRAKSATR